MLVTNDQSIFIERAIDNVQEHALLGGILVVLIIFAFLRDFRSTLIVSHVDSGLGDRHVRAALLRRLHAEHDDLRRPRARHRHDRRRGDRRAREHAPAPAHGQGPDDGRDRRQRGSLVRDPDGDAHAHRGVHSAAVPLGLLEHPVRPALVRRDVLARDVALRRGHDRAGALLALAAHAGRGGRRARASSDGCSAPANSSSKAWTNGTGRCCTSRSRIGRR